MRLAGLVIAAAVLVLVVFPAGVGPFGGPNGAAEPDFGWQAIVVMGVIVAAVLGCVFAIVVEVRHLLARRRGPGGPGRGPRGHPA